jgi:hypothetical protein
MANRGIVFALLVTMLAGGCARPSVKSDPPPPGMRTPSTAAPAPLREVGLVGNGSVAWTFVRLGDRDTDVVVAVSGLACREVVGAHVTETATAVTIAVLAGPTRPGRCEPDERTMVALIRAPQPIGSRTIRHALLTA